MKELNIAPIIVQKRREKGITQEELASYFGVSKASVSKWETGQSYPDITFLPQLASYFNISVDELLCYEPQMKREEIRKLYQHICLRFTKEPWDDVYADCREISHKYFSCFPLLCQLGTLYLNHFMLASEPEKGQRMLQDALVLFQRVEQECKEPLICKDAFHLEAYTYLLMQKPQKLLDLLGETLPRTEPHIEMMAQAWQMLDNNKKALECIQVSSYQHLMSLIECAPHFMTLTVSQPDHMKEVLHRTLTLIDLFQIDIIHPNSSLLVYLTAAQLFCTLQDKTSALDMLKRYVTLGSGISEFKVKGDNYFNAIDPWFEELYLGTTVPRNQKIIKQSMIQGITQNPAFAFLESESEYRLLLKQLTDH